MRSLTNPLGSKRKNNPPPLLPSNFSCGFFSKRPRTVLWDGGCGGFRLISDLPFVEVTGGWTTVLRTCFCGDSDAGGRFLVAGGENGSRDDLLKATWVDWLVKRAQQLFQRRGFMFEIADLGVGLCDISVLGRVYDTLCICILSRQHLLPARQNAPYCTISARPTSYTLRPRNTSYLSSSFAAL